VSSILDALKKSEADRQRAAGPTLLDLRVQPSKRRLPTWVVALGVLLAGNAVLLGWLALRHAPDAGTAAVAPTALPAPPPAATPAATPASAPVGALSAGAPSAAELPSALGVSPMAQAPAGSARGAQPSAAEADENPADEAPATEPAPRRSRGTASAGSLQNYSALSANLPPLHLDLHFWSEVPAERYALINLHRVGEGDTLPDGPRVLEITREGVVMEFGGREFVLGRE
jgi:general secretion pathway protein B